MSSQPPPEAAEAAVLTHVGRKRRINEDTVGQKNLEAGGVYIIADGMGGHRTGEVASMLAVEQTLQHISTSDISPSSLLEALEQANHAIYEAGQRSESRGMGTTATVLILDLPYALIGHAGDSRAYLLRGGKLCQLTQDHSWVAERMRQGLLTREEARNHRWRNVITNALGSLPEARVDLIGMRVKPDDIFMLCSDGLSGVLEDEVLEEVLKQATPKEATERLVKLANEWGGPDNISVVVVHVLEVPKNPEYRAYAQPLESGDPVTLRVGNDAEALTTHIYNPPAKPSFWRRYLDSILLIILIIMVILVLLQR